MKRSLNFAQKGVRYELKMHSQIYKLSAILVWLLFAGLCYSCSEKKSGETDSKNNVSKTEPTEVLIDTLGAVMPNIIANYSVAKLSRLAADYNLGYTLFVVSADGISLTADVSTLNDYRVNWNRTYVANFSDSGATIHFGEIVNLNSLADTIEPGRVIISLQPGSLAEVPSVASEKSGVNSPVHIRCETLLADSSGIICALGFSTKP